MGEKLEVDGSVNGARAHGGGQEISSRRAHSQGTSTPGGTHKS